MAIFLNLFYHPTFFWAAWIIVILIPVTLIAAVLLPMLQGKKGAGISLIISLLPLAFGFINFLSIRSVTLSAINNVPANYIEFELFRGISTSLIILYFGAVITSMSLVFTALFTLIFIKNKKSVIPPVVVLILIGLLTVGISENIAKYDACAYAQKSEYDRMPRSKLLESIFFTEKTQKRIEEYKSSNN